MPRPRGKHGRDASTAIAIRVPDDLLELLRQAAGADGGSAFAEWFRNVLRRQVNIPIDYEAGYEEGKAAGWADAQERFRAAMKGV
jgi:hypothetical protein